MRGKKVLVLDPLLSGPLALIAQPLFLKVSCLFQSRKMCLDFEFTHIACSSVEDDISLRL